MEQSLSSLAPSPNHVAIIMDGNGRWAQARGLPRTVGHRRGAEAMRGVISAAIEHGVRYLTVFAFSSENWKRPVVEVSDLMSLFRHYLRNEVDNLQEHSVCLRFIGQRSRLPGDLIRLLDSAETRTRSNDRLIVTLALSYGSRQEIVAAARCLLQQVKAGQIEPSQIDELLFAESLMTRDMPDPELVIRTGGEQRLSNFLLWQLAEAQVIFTDTLWPDFSKQHLAAAIREYKRRMRVFEVLTYA